MINDVWNAVRTVGVRSRGNFDKDVELILVDLLYEDTVNKYSQTKSVALDKDNKFFDWQFPVISETAGKVTFSGTIKYQDGKEEPIAKTDTTNNTILVGPQVTGFVEVQVLADLIDFDKVKLAKVSLQYTDPENGINERKDIIFKPGATDSVNWKVELKNKTKRSYTWQAMYFMADGSMTKTDLIDTEEPTLVLELSKAKAAAAAGGGN
jgi:hypothetical protein